MSSGAVVGLLDTLTFPELLTILVVGLVVLGPEKLPGIARQAGEWMAKLRAVSQNLQREVQDVLDEPEMQSLKELGEFAARPRAKLAEYARNAALDTGDDDEDSPTKVVRTGADHPMAVAPVEPTVSPDEPTVADVEAVTAEPIDAPEPVQEPEPVAAIDAVPSGAADDGAEVEGDRPRSTADVGSPEET